MDIKMTKITPFLTQISCFILLALYSGITTAQPLDKIAVIVNNDVIMASQVYQLARQLKSNPKAQALSEEVLIKEAVEQLIHRKLQLQKAKQIGLTVDDSNLNITMQQLAQKNKLSMEQFRIALGREGLDFNTFRESIRERIILAELRKMQLKRTSHVTNQQVNDLIANQSSQLSQGVDFKVQHIHLSAPTGTPLPKLLAVQKKAYALRHKLLMAPSKDFAKYAKATEWKSSTTYNKSQLRTLSLLEKGQISDVFQDPTGFHIIKLIDKRGVKQQVVSEYLVRHILIKSTPESNDAVLRQKLSLLREKIAAGSDFASMAKKYSQDTGSAIRGGSLGWSTADKYVPQFATVIKKTPLKQISQPFKSQFGWHILQVLDTKQNNRTEDLLRKRAKSLINNDKAQKDYENWVKQLRNDAFVEYRI